MRSPFLVLSLALLVGGCAAPQGSVPMVGGYVFRAYCEEEGIPLTGWTRAAQAVKVGQLHYHGDANNRGATWHRWELQWRWDPELTQQKLEGDQ